MTTRRSGLFNRLFTDEHGDLRTAVLLGGLVAVVAVLAIGTYAALLIANAGSPGTLALWVTVAFVVIKLPLLAVAWWVISRKQDAKGGGGWETRELREILEYLETQARRSAGAPDELRRLRYFAREAWFVADRAADADKGTAVETAVRIDALAAAASRPRLPRRPAGH